MLSSVNKHAGYLLIDHSESPGVPSDLAHDWAKYGTVTAPGSTKLERDSYICSHCQRGVVVNPDRERNRAVCRRCMHIVCDRCSNPNLPCKTFAEIAEAVLSGTYHQSPTGLILPSKG